MGNKAVHCCDDTLNVPGTSRGADFGPFSASPLIPSGPTEMLHHSAVCSSKRMIIFNVELHNSFNCLPAIASIDRTRVLSRCACCPPPTHPNPKHNGLDWVSSAACCSRPCDSTSFCRLRTSQASLSRSNQPPIPTQASATSGTAWVESLGFPSEFMDSASKSSPKISSNRRELVWTSFHGRNSHLRNSLATACHLNLGLLQSNPKASMQGRVG